MPRNIRDKEPLPSLWESSSIVLELHSIIIISYNRICPITIWMAIKISSEPETVCSASQNRYRKFIINILYVFRLQATFDKKVHNKYKEKMRDSQLGLV